MNDVRPVDRFRYPADEALIDPYEFYRGLRSDDADVSRIRAKGFPDFNSLTGINPSEHSRFRCLAVKIVLPRRFASPVARPTIS